MAQWQRTLYLNPEWAKAKTGEISIHDLAQTIASRLRSLSSFDDDYIDDERGYIAEDFDDIATDLTKDREDFDDAMVRLYDWGDTSLDDKFGGKKVCWIDTMSRNSAIDIK